MSKKLFLSVAAVGVMAISGAAQADAPSWAAGGTASGNFDVRGSVAETCVIQINDLATVLDLQGGESGAEVAQVTENCNSGNGYSISFSSGSQGMVHTEDASRSVSYQLNYDGNAMSDLSAGLSLSRSGEVFSDTNSVTIDVTGDESLIAGTYLDLITVSIAAA